MAYPTAVNSQITDAVTQSNVKVKGETPATTDATESALAKDTDVAKEKGEADQQGIDRAGHPG